MKMDYRHLHNWYPLKQPYSCGCLAYVSDKNSVGAMTLCPKHTKGYYEHEIRLLEAQKKEIDSAIQKIKQGHCEVYESDSDREWWHGMYKPTQEWIDQNYNPIN